VVNENLVRSINQVNWLRRRTSWRYADVARSGQNYAAVLTALKGAVATGAWPTTSSASAKALEAKGIPSRSALLMIGLLSGISTQSTSFDGINGPATQL
jgi:hypothetical protein